MKITSDNYSSLARALRCFTSRFSWLSLAFGVYHHLLRLLSVDLGSCRSRYILVALGSFRCLSPLPPPFYIYICLLKITMVLEMRLQWGCLIGIFIHGNEWVGYIGWSPWVCGWKKFKIGEYFAKLQARVWLSHALCAHGQHTAKRRRKCTRQSRSCL